MQEADIRYDGRWIYTEQFNLKGFGQTHQEIRPDYVIQETQRNVRFYISLFLHIYIYSWFFFILDFLFTLNEWSTLKSAEVTTADQTFQVFLLQK